MAPPKIETAWHGLGIAWLSFSKWHPPTQQGLQATIFLPVIEPNWEGLEEIYRSFCRSFCKEIPKISKEPTQISEPVIFPNWQKADEKWTRVIAPIKVRVITPFQPQVKIFGSAEAKWEELYELLTAEPEITEPEALEFEMTSWWYDAEQGWRRFHENEKALSRQKPPRIITPFRGRFFDWPRLERVFKAILSDIPKPKTNGHVKSPSLPSFEFRKWWEAERLFGLLVHWQPKQPHHRNGSTPTQFVFSNWVSTDMAFRGITTPMPMTDYLAPAPASLTIEQAAKPPRIHSWQSHSLTLRRGAEDWPTSKAKKNRPKEGGSMQVGRWAISTRLYEGVEERPGWYGKMRRVWVTRKIAEMTQLDWVECLTQAEGNTKLAEKLFHNQTRWVINRINPATRGRWEARNEWHERRNGLEVNGCKKPRWMSKEEFAEKMATPFGQYLQSTDRASSTPGNPDLRAKFQNLK